MVFRRLLPKDSVDGAEEDAIVRSPDDVEDDVCVCVRERERERGREGCR
jgi:hypothetical protein